MANIGFYRPNPKRVTGGSVLAQNIVNGSSLDGITDPGAGPMGLDKPTQTRVETCIAIDLSHEVLLMLGLGVSFSSESDQSW